MLRIDQILDELKQLRDDAFKGIDKLKQEKQNLPQILEEHARKEREHMEQFEQQSEEIRRELGDDSFQINLPSMSNILLDHKDHFYDLRNTLICASFTNYTLLLSMTSVNHILSITNACKENPDDRAANALDMINQIKGQLEIYRAEIRSEINAFYNSLQGESEQARKKAEASFDGLPKIMNSIDDLIKLQVTQIKLAQEQHQTLMQLKILMQQASQAEKDKLLRVAALSTDVTLILLLIERGADISSQGDKFRMNALHFVCRSGDVDCLRALINGQDKNILLKALGAKNAEGKTPSAFIRELQDNVVKKEMLELIGSVIAPRDHTASQLHQLRMSSSETRVSPVVALEKRCKDDTEYQSPNRLAR